MELLTSLVMFLALSRGLSQSPIALLSLRIKQIQVLGMFAGLSSTSTRENGSESFAPLCSCLVVALVLETVQLFLPYFNGLSYVYMLWTLIRGPKDFCCLDQIVVLWTLIWMMHFNTCFEHVLR